MFQTHEEFDQYMEKFKQDILLAIPEIVVRHIQLQHEFKKIVDDFYKHHPDLKDERLLVSALVTKIQADNPSMEPAKVFREAGLKARKILREQNNERV